MKIKFLLLLLIATPAFAGLTYNIEDIITICEYAGDPDYMIEEQKIVVREIEYKNKQVEAAEREAIGSLGKGCVERYFNWKTLSFMERAVECN